MLRRHSTQLTRLTLSTQDNSISKLKLKLAQYPQLSSIEVCISSMLCAGTHVLVASEALAASWLPEPACMASQSKSISGSTATACSTRPASTCTRITRREFCGRAQEHTCSLPSFLSTFEVMIREPTQRLCLFAPMGLLVAVRLQLQFNLGMMHLTVAARLLKQIKQPSSTRCCAWPHRLRPFLVFLECVPAVLESSNGGHE